MGEYFTVPEARERAVELCAAFDDLLSRPRVAARPKSRQWTFLRSALERLLSDGPVECPFTRQQATQYKFEVDERLRHFYLSPGRPVPFVFRLMDRQRAIRLMLVDDAYPHLQDYVLLVSVARPELLPTTQTHELREYLASVVDRGANAEFAAYRLIPNTDCSPLEPYFVREGSAWQRIQNVIKKHAEKGWVIGEPLHNPSTMRVIKVRLLELGTSRAFARSQEYWYLRWWSRKDEKYVHIYQETQYQGYALVRQEDRWLIDANIYPQPRSTSPVRKP